MGVGVAVGVGVLVGVGVGVGVGVTVGVGVGVFVGVGVGVGTALRMKGEETSEVLLPPSVAVATITPPSAAPRPVTFVITMVFSA